MNRSQELLVLDHLAKHGSITPLEALKRYGIFRLGARIHRLRKHLNIVTEYEQSQGKRYARYRLS